jgi:hypothetical protein
MIPESRAPPGRPPGTVVAWIPAMALLLREVRLAVRRLLKAPRFTAIAIPRRTSGPLCSGPGASPLCWSMGAPPIESRPCTPCTATRSPETAGSRR